MNLDTSHTGSQFHDDYSGLIDPRILAQDDGQRTQRFNHDVESATQARNSYAYRHQWPLTRVRNASSSQQSSHATVRETTSYSPIEQTSMPRNEAGWTQTSRKRPRFSPRTRPDEDQAGPSVSGRLQKDATTLNKWEANNPFAALTSDIHMQDRDQEDDRHVDEVMSTPPRSTYPDECYPTPPWSGTQCWPSSEDVPSDHMGQRSAARPRSDTTSVHQLNVPTTPIVKPPSGDSMANWNRTVYNLGDRTRSKTTANRPRISSEGHRRTTSVTPSASAHSMSCEACGKGFDKEHELNHHIRWHGDRMHLCSRCGKAFVAAKDMHRHEKIHDKASRHLLCNIMGCRYGHIGFARKDHLKRHIEKRHPGNLLSPPDSSSFAGD